MTPAWSIANGLSSVVSEFMAGFGICEIAGVSIFAALLSFWLLKRLLSAAGL